VDAVAIDAGRNIYVILVQQGFAVSADGVFIVDLSVTLAARSRNVYPRLVQRQRIVRAVAIDTDRSIHIAFLHGVAVGIVGNHIGLIGVTILAGLIQGYRIFAVAGGGNGRVWIFSVVRVAAAAGHLFLTMHRFYITSAAYVRTQGTTVRKFNSQIGVGVAGEALLVFLYWFLRKNRRRANKPQQHKKYAKS
jgi:hypothetical protein